MEMGTCVGRFYIVEKVKAILGMDLIHFKFVHASPIEISPISVTVHCHTIPSDFSLVFIPRSLPFFKKMKEETEIRCLLQQSVLVP